MAGVVTLRLAVEAPLGAIVPLEKEMEGAPGVGARVGDPHPAVEAPVGLATTMAPGEVGNVSLKLTPLSATPFGLLRVKVRVEAPPTTLGLGGTRSRKDGG